jgi:hypothetical protein
MLLYPFLSLTHSLSLRVSPSLSVCHRSSDSCPLFSFLTHKQTFTYTISPHFLSLRLARFLTLPVWLTLLHFLFLIPGKGQGPGKEDLEREILCTCMFGRVWGKPGGEETWATRRDSKTEIVCLNPILLYAWIPYYFINSFNIRTYVPINNFLENVRISSWRFVSA